MQSVCCEIITFVFHSFFGCPHCRANSESGNIRGNNLVVQLKTSELNPWECTKLHQIIWLFNSWFLTSSAFSAWSAWFFRASWTEIWRACFWYRLCSGFAWASAKSSLCFLLSACFVIAQKPSLMQKGFPLGQLAFPGQIKHTALVASAS